jgi:hypothetical protein
VRLGTKLETITNGSTFFCFLCFLISFLILFLRIHPKRVLIIAGLCCALAESLDGQLVRPDGQSPSRKSSSRALSREDRAV